MESETDFFTAEMWPMTEPHFLPEVPISCYSSSALHVHTPNEESVVESSSDAGTSVIQSPSPKTEGKRRGRKPSQGRRLPPSVVERRYREKLRSGLTELSKAVLKIPASSPYLAYNNPNTTGSIEPAKNRKKHTVIAKAVEYIQHLEAENRALLMTLANSLSEDEQCPRKCTHSSAAVGEDYLSDKLWLDLESIC